MMVGETTGKFNSVLHDLDDRLLAELVSVFLSNPRFRCILPLIISCGGSYFPCGRIWPRYSVTLMVGSSYLSHHIRLTIPSLEIRELHGIVNILQ